MSINNEFTPPIIIDYDYYVSQYVLPVTDNVAGQKDLIDRWIIQCQDQIDVLCGGRVYQEYNDLDLTKDKDKLRQYYLRKAVCSLLEYYIDTGKAFVDKNFSSSSNVPANINASSEDANFEHKRKDIIKLLVQGDWYQTFQTYSNALDTGATRKQPIGDISWDNLVDRLSEIFKRLDNKNSFNTNQVLNNHNLTHIKELVGYNAANSFIRNFKLDSSVDLSNVVKVSNAGTSSAKANFITINGVEWLIGGAGGGLVQDVKQNGESVLNFQTGVANIDAYKREDAQRKVYYGETEPEEPQDNDIWVSNSSGGIYADYSNLVNKPKINNVELDGNKALSELGIYGQYDAARPTETTYNSQEIDQKVSEGAAIFRGSFTGGTTRPESFDYNTFCTSQMEAEGITPTNADYLFVYWSDLNEYDRCRYTQATNTWQYEYTVGQYQQIQSDWNQTDPTKVDYIKNKPSISSHLYAHNISISHHFGSGSSLNNQVDLTLTIYTNNNTQFTFVTLLEYIHDHKSNFGINCCGMVSLYDGIIDTHFPIIYLSESDFTIYYVQYIDENKRLVSLEISSAAETQVVDNVKQVF